MSAQVNVRGQLANVTLDPTSGSVDARWLVLVDIGSQVDFRR